MTVFDTIGPSIGSRPTVTAVRSRASLLLAAVVAVLAACDDSSGSPTGTTSNATTATSQPAAIAPTGSTSTVAAELGPDGLADCEVVLGVIGEVVQHPDTAEAVNADPATADERATREAFDAVAVRFGALELRDPTVAAAAALGGQPALDVARAEGTAVDLIDPSAESFVAMSDLCASVADEAPPVT